MKEGLVYICMVVIFVVGAIIGGGRMISASSNVRENCKPTDFYVIGDKGHTNRVYDCTSYELIL